MAPMTANPRKSIALLATTAGLGILVVAGIILYRPLQEQYWLWRLEVGTEDDRVLASRELAELRSV